MSTFNQNSQSILARVLAQKNIRVEFNPTAQTAMFDIASKTMTLPVLKDEESENVKTTFIGHECGHALYSPYREKDTKSNGNWWIEAEQIGGMGNADYVQGIFNIVEDARIEKLMKTEFPGLRREFSAGYRELADRNFFGTVGADISTLGFVDRLNVHFKCGSLVNVPFSAEEQSFVDRMEKMESFDDMISIGADIFSFVGGKRNDSSKKRENDVPVVTNVVSNKNNSDQSSSSNSTSSESNENNAKSESSSSQNGEKKSQSEQNQDGSGNQEGNEKKNGNNIGVVNAGTGVAPDVLPQMNTQKNFDQQQKNLINSNVRTTRYSDIGVPNIENIVMPIKKTHEILSNSYAQYGKTQVGNKIMNRIHKEFDGFIKSTTPTINTLIKQFEMRKAADVQKRTSISRTGKVDCDRLYKYKVTDDIFSRFSRVAEGKNHGMVMYIDWSSSMQPVTDDVINQVIILTQFCRRMAIPFDVYMFSSQYPILTHYGIVKNSIKTTNYGEYNILNQWSESHKHKMMSQYNSFKNSDAAYCTEDHPEQFALIHILSSDTSKNTTNQSLMNLFTLAKMITRPASVFDNTNYKPSYIPEWFGQGNTPLDSTVIAAMKMVPEFQKKHKVQIMNTIFLTDGETGHSPIHTSSLYSSEKCFVRCPFNNKEYVADGPTSTDVLLEIFRDVTQSTTIGFFVCSSKYCRYFDADAKIQRKKLNDEGFIDAPKMKDGSASYNYASRKYDKVQKTKNHGYDRLFILPSRQEIETDMQELNKIQSGATLTAIRNAFITAVENRNASRSFLNRFADVIANPALR